MRTRPRPATESDDQGLEAATVAAAGPQVISSSSSAVAREVPAEGSRIDGAAGGRGGVGSAAVGAGVDVDVGAGGAVVSDKAPTKHTHHKHSRNISLSLYQTDISL